MERRDRRETASSAIRRRQRADRDIRGERIVDSDARLCGDDGRRRAVVGQSYLVGVTCRRTRGGGEQTRRRRHERAYPVTSHASAASRRRSLLHPHEELDPAWRPACVKRVRVPGRGSRSRRPGRRSIPPTASPLVARGVRVEAAAELVEQHGGEATVSMLWTGRGRGEGCYASVGMTKAAPRPIGDGDWDLQRTAQDHRRGAHRSG